VSNNSAVNEGSGECYMFAYPLSLAIMDPEGINDDAFRCWLENYSVMQPMRGSRLDIKKSKRRENQVLSFQTRIFLFQWFYSQLFAVFTPFLVTLRPISF
jgi:hypothetical protein